MSARSRYIRRVRAVDHRKWARVRLEGLVRAAVQHEFDQWFLENRIRGGMTGEPLGFSQAKPR